MKFKDEITLVFKSLEILIYRQLSFLLHILMVWEIQVGWPGDRIVLYCHWVCCSVSFGLFVDCKWAPLEVRKRLGCLSCRDVFDFSGADPWLSHLRNKSGFFSFGRGVQQELLWPQRQEYDFSVSCCLPLSGRTIIAKTVRVWAIKPGELREPVVEDCGVLISASSWIPRRLLLFMILDEQLLPEEVGLLHSFPYLPLVHLINYVSGRGLEFQTGV